MRRRSMWLALLAVLALAVAACGDDDGGDDGDTEGGTVSIMGALVEDDQANLLASIEPWAEDNGIEIEYEGSGDFETLINTRVDGGNPPDIALFPQPGLMREVNQIGDGLRDLSEVIDMDAAEETFVDGVLDDGTIDGELLGVMYRLNLKSLVWYPVPEFEEAGYSEPETWDELQALADQMVADGNTPWCIGIESAGATGWVITDWLEDIMLRTVGLEGVDDWVAGDLAFDSPEMQRAAELFEEVTGGFSEDYVLGGSTGIVTTPFGDAATPMFEDPPACFMHRQAQFIEGFFPDEVQENLEEEVNFFPVPAIDEEHGNPALTAGDLVSLLTDNPAAEDLAAYMATPESGEAWAQAGAFLSPHQTFDASLYPTAITERQGEFLADASFARFDPSDDMPAAVGTGAFWSEMTEWVSGNTDLDTALPAIDEAYPDS